MTEPLDEYTIQSIPDYDGKKVQSLTKENLKLGNEEKMKEKEKIYNEQYKGLIEFLKKVYGTKVKGVSVSFRIAQSPAVLVTAQYGWSANMVGDSVSLFPFF